MAARLVLVAIALAVAVVGVVAAGSLRPIWTEQFDGGLGVFRPDSAYWADLGLDSRPADSQISVGGGVLTLSASRTGTNSGKAYAGGVVSTRKTFARRGGYIEARIRYSAGMALWPAFWLYGESGTDDEIDVLEAYPNGSGWPANSQYQVTAHHAGVKTTLTVSAPSDLTGDWHTFGVDWRPRQRLDYYLDGRIVASLRTGIPENPMYVLLDIAVGNWSARADDTTPADGHVDVDYVSWWSARPLALSIPAR